MQLSAPIRRRFAGLVVRAIVPPLIVLMFSAPVMACMMEAATLSVSEAECCRQMQGDCHASIGPASHKCCRTFAGAADTFAPAKAAALQFAVVATLSIPDALPVNTAAALPVAISPSPPGSPPGSSTILRI